MYFNITNVRKLSINTVFVFMLKSIKGSVSLSVSEASSLKPVDLR